MSFFRVGFHNLANRLSYPNASFAATSLCAALAATDITHTPFRGSSCLILFGMGSAAGVMASEWLEKRIGTDPVPNAQKTNTLCGLFSLGVGGFPSLFSKYWAAPVVTGLRVGAMLRHTYYHLYLFHAQR